MRCGLTVDGRLAAAYDVSLKEGFDTLIWCIIENGTVIRGVNIVPASSVALDSLRIELTGIYTILRVVICVARIHWLKEGGVEIGSDFDDPLLPTLLCTKVLPYNNVQGLCWTSSIVSTI